MKVLPVNSKQTIPCVKCTFAEWFNPSFRTNFVTESQFYKRQSAEACSILYVLHVLYVKLYLSICECMNDEVVY